ncbi:ABC transporter sub-family G-like protein 18, partial [Leptotrombidium deliense]
MENIEFGVRDQFENNDNSDSCPYSIDSPNASIQWNELSCELKKLKIDIFIEKFVYRKSETTNTIKVFNNLCGQFKFGELSAVMGPSGAGKSKMLECIVCRRENGVNGFVGLNGLQKIKVAFIPQNDHYFSVLTIREAVMFACKLQRTLKTKNDCENKVNMVLKQLSLEKCADTRICNLSGGQSKRLSICQELVSEPDILILDEPTSGLDSSSCIRTIELLCSLTQQNQSMAIIASIHQPSATIFNLFSRIYILSSIGSCIYDGPPNNVIEWINGFNLSIPQYYNPADFMIDVSNGVYGNDCIQQMSAEVTQRFKRTLDKNQSKAIKMSKCFTHEKRSIFNHIKQLSARSMLILLRDPLAFLFQVLIHVLISVNIAVLLY